MIPTVTVDANKALARFSPAGIPEAVRRNLRMVIPDLTKSLGALVNSKLDSGLQSRRRIDVTQEMRESPSAIYGKVAAVWTGDKKSSMVPQVLESGAVAHAIVGVNAKALSFFWPKVGKQMMLKSVWHPGFAGIFYMRDSFAAMRGQIVGNVRSAVLRGMNES